MKTLIVLNDAPYGSERLYNGLRLAGSLSRQPGLELQVFLIGDAVGGARKNQKLPTGYYNIQTMLAAIVRHGATLGVCGSCIDARGIAETDLLEGSRRSSMEELTAWTLAADKVITF